MSKEAKYSTRRFRSGTRPNTSERRELDDYVESRIQLMKQKAKSKIWQAYYETLAEREDDDV